MITNHRYEELINREEIISDYINRENVISDGEVYIKDLIVKSGIISEGEFRSKIKDYYVTQTINPYTLTYNTGDDRFILTKSGSTIKYYYSLTLQNMNPNLTEITY
ncbi:hypothetical protein ACPWSR_17180 [Alloiococcus sp. CFN-8]|uniref:hypothetical protein n=1 Tax=Alloiococcus sp. CFN-8 TaxID=3416081 RepID=UPI003CE78498